MAADPTIAVIVPVFNRAKIVGRCINSVLAQEPGSAEFIVVNDGSSDDTAVVLEQLSQRYPHLKVLNLAENRGPSACRNAGAKATRSDWLYFLDSDDELMPGALGIVAETIRAHDCAVVSVLAKSIFPDGQELFVENQVVPEDLDRQSLLALQRRPYTQSQIAVRRELFEHIGGFDEAFRQVEDADLWQRMVRTKATFHQIPQVLVRKHERSPEALTLNRSEAFQYKRMFWRKHAAAARKELEHEHYVRWWFRQLNWAYRGHSFTSAHKTKLRKIDILDYCLRWLLLLVHLDKRSRSIAFLRIKGALRAFIGLEPT